LLMGKRNYFYVHNGGMFEMTERTQKAKWYSFRGTKIDQ
jgi:hypothetical protein